MDKRRGAGARCCRNVQRTPRNCWAASRSDQWPGHNTPFGVTAATSIECLASSDHLRSPNCSSNISSNMCFTSNAFCVLKLGHAHPPGTKGTRRLHSKEACVRVVGHTHLRFGQKGASVPRARLFEYNESWNQSNEVQLIN